MKEILVEMVGDYNRRYQLNRKKERKKEVRNFLQSITGSKYLIGCSPIAAHRFFSDKGEKIRFKVSVLRSWRSSSPTHILVMFRGKIFNNKYRLSKTDSLPKQFSLASRIFFLNLFLTWSLWKGTYRNFALGHFQHLFAV